MSNANIAITRTKHKKSKRKDGLKSYKPEIFMEVPKIDAPTKRELPRQISKAFMKGKPTPKEPLQSTPNLRDDYIVQKEFAKRPPRDNEANLGDRSSKVHPHTHLLGNSNRSKEIRLFCFASYQI